MGYEHLGLVVIPDFISEEEEAEILKNIAPSEKVKKGSGRNSIKRFGSNVPYKGNIVSTQVPDFLSKIAEKIHTQGFLNIIPDSVTINEYLKGQSISAHIDSAGSGPIITILGLASAATMKFELRNQNSFQIEFPPRCLVQLKGEIRTTWKHSILPVKDTRYSIVFRCSDKKN